MRDGELQQLWARNGAMEAQRGRNDLPKVTQQVRKSTGLWGLNAKPLSFNFAIRIKTYELEGGHSCEGHSTGLGTERGP